MCECIDYIFSMNWQCEWDLETGINHIIITRTSECQWSPVSKISLLCNSHAVASSLTYSNCFSTLCTNGCFVSSQ